MIEALITRLVREAPMLDPAAIETLVDALAKDGRPLALAIAKVVTLVGHGRIDAGIALPALAMACTTLCDERLTEREHEAARYEIETLLPLPVAPDVTVDALRSGSRRRT